MKIALIIERMDAGRGGREKSTAQIAAALVRRGHTVEVLCQRGRLDSPGVTVRPLGRRGLSRRARLEHFVADVQRALDGGGYDASHAMLPVPGASIYQPRGGTVPGQIAASVRRRGALGGWAVRLGSALNGQRRAMGRLEAQLVTEGKTLCLAGSAMVAREFADHYGRTDRVRVVFNAVDIPDVSQDDRDHWRQETRYRLNIERDEVVFLTAAANLGLKAVDKAILALARWRSLRAEKPRARLIVLGGESSDEGYQRIASLNGVAPFTHFLPATKEIFRYYSAADVCLLLSWYDACSRVVLEAVRWGLPCITTRYNGAAEALAGGAGLVVSNPADLREVAAAYETLYDPEARRHAAEACRAEGPRLAMDRQIDELEQAYREASQTR